VKKKIYNATNKKSKNVTHTARTLSSSRRDKSSQLYTTAFLAQVPKWLRILPDTIVLLSGVVEILLGASLFFLSNRRITFGWIDAIFFVAVFPGNIAQIANHKDAFGLNSDLPGWIRLPFQPLLIILILWSIGACGTWRKKMKLKNSSHELQPQRGNY
jgi:uncharacterized membrane protein